MFRIETIEYQIVTKKKRRKKNLTISFGSLTNIVKTQEKKNERLTINRTKKNNRNENKSLVCL